MLWILKSFYRIRGTQHILNEKCRTHRKHLARWNVKKSHKKKCKLVKGLTFQLLKTCMNVNFIHFHDSTYANIQQIKFAKFCFYNFLKHNVKLKINMFCVFLFYTCMYLAWASLSSTSGINLIFSTSIRLPIWQNFSFHRKSWNSSRI